MQKFESFISSPKNTITWNHLKYDHNISSFTSFHYPQLETSFCNKLMYLEEAEKRFLSRFDVLLVRLPSGHLDIVLPLRAEHSFSIPCTLVLDVPWEQKGMNYGSSNIHLRISWSHYYLIPGANFSDSSSLIPRDMKTPSSTLPWISLCGSLTHVDVLEFLG